MSKLTFEVGRRPTTTKKVNSKGAAARDAKLPPENEAVVKS